MTKSRYLGASVLYEARQGRQTVVAIGKASDTRFAFSPLETIAIGQIATEFLADFLDRSSAEWRSLPMTLSEAPTNNVGALHFLTPEEATIKGLPVDEPALFFHHKNILSVAHFYLALVDFTTRLSIAFEQTSSFAERIFAIRCEISEEFLTAGVPEACRQAAHATRQ